MNKILTALFLAQRKLPTSIPGSEQRDMLLTLLFWKMLSDLRRGKARYRETTYSGVDSLLLQMVQRNRVTLLDSCMYESCQWSKPFDAGTALRKSLYEWANAQANHALDGVLRPERFGFLSPHYTVLSNSTALSDAANLIGGLALNDPADDWTLGEIFRRAMELMPGAQNAVPANVAQLLVELLNPLSGDVICDPACGSGQLLLSCVDYVAPNFPGHRLVLLGQESQSNQWALAKMQLLLNGLLLHKLERGDALDKPLLFGERLSLLQADVVLTRLPDQAEPWDHDNARHENFHRFPLAPPKDSRLAMIWTLLASMKPVVGRMGVLMQPDVLVSEEGALLRRYLLERNWLDAIITLPRQMRKLVGEPPILMLVRQQREHDSVAFIAASVTDSQAASQYDIKKIKQAYTAWRERHSHRFLRAITGTAMAAQQYSFDLSDYPIDQ